MMHWSESALNATYLLILLSRLDMVSAMQSMMVVSPGLTSSQRQSIHTCCTGPSLRSMPPTLLILLSRLEMVSAMQSMMAESHG
mmetsp:Transcript_6941/g.9850  ORF Transcript_6941/g.9850 Transcript_6941/m.9850 type:complete len:84 (+) Transcript_6941:209-460(+)